jgi:hypothetical protein
MTAREFRSAQLVETTSRLDLAQTKREFRRSVICSVSATLYQGLRAGGISQTSATLPSTEKTAP